MPFLERDQCLFLVWMILLIILNKISPSTFLPSSLLILYNSLLIRFEWWNQGMHNIKWFWFSMSSDENPHKGGFDFISCFLAFSGSSGAVPMALRISSVVSVMFPVDFSRGFLGRLKQPLMFCWRKKWEGSLLIRSNTSPSSLISGTCSTATIQCLLEGCYYRGSLVLEQPIRIYLI